MDRKKLALLLGAMVVAIGTALAARSMFAGAATPQVEAATVAPAAEVPQGPKVLVAKRGLPVGTIITADAVSYQLWPQEMVQDAYFIEGEADMDKLLGTVVRYPITAGEPVTRGGLVAQGDRGFLAAALSPGMRAVTVSVSVKTGVGGFVFPGDRVDMMLTQTLEGGDGGAAFNSTETILRNLRILATDQSTETTTDPDGKTVVRAVRTVTLEVTPRIAEKIQVAEQIGTLSFSLRSIADNQSDLERALAQGEVTLPDNISKEDEEKLLRRAVTRPQDGASTFVTGGDVSRFQRSALPRPAGAPEAAPSGPPAPTVRVTRGQTTTVDTIGQGAGAMLDRQGEGMATVGRVAPSALSTLR